MSEHSWTEYLAAASEHLAASRRAVEQGAASPDPPAHPAGPLPEELASQAQRLADAFDQLALEVATRMTDIELHLGPRRVDVPAGPYYVDQMA
ncbi:MAG TPA: hypothetical protein VMF35_10400 [Acidimicrobiales bacterium]|nr:hypothetical protein [Acidimicrobiales bacterium]